MSRPVIFPSQPSRCTLCNSSRIRTYVRLYSVSIESNRDAVPFTTTTHLPPPNWCPFYSAMEPSNSHNNNDSAAREQASATVKSQPWRAHWPPKVVDSSAPYGFKKGEIIVNSGN